MIEVWIRLSMRSVEYNRLMKCIFLLKEARQEYE
jgi:hypothetical protein